MISSICKSTLFNSVRKLKISINTAMSISEISSSKCFEGYQKVFQHFSNELNCDMNFGIYLPPNPNKNQEIPVLYWLSGITCTEQNFIQKSGAQKYAAKHGICIVSPDTSPRNVNIPGEDDSTDFGSSAGFYVDATEYPWSKHYRMYSYITKELIKVIEGNFPVMKNKRSISGHSMGGHGALICALKNPELYCSVSALEPLANPIKSRLGQKAFQGYLGSNKIEWSKWDATELALKYNDKPIEIFLDQGTNDSYYDDKELLPENFIESASKNDKIKCIYKTRDGYDHSFYYVASVIEEHIEYHLKFLKV